MQENYLFDPVQFKEFGYDFYQGEGFSYRYQFSKKLFWKNIYIPFGPNCITKQGFLSFLLHINKLKFTKIMIDLPMIYCKERKREVISMLEENGFKKTSYIHQDEETIIFNKNDFKINSKLRNKIRHGLEKCKIITKNNLTDREMQDLYNIYLESGKRIGFESKKIDVFKKMSENCLVSLAYYNNTMVGFVFGYLFDVCAVDFCKKDIAKIMLVIFTAQNELGRKNRIGHAIHYDLFEKAFQHYNVEMVDFHGASRAKNRTYVSFKQEFCLNFYLLPGSFVKKL